ncbi:unnamed protein product [Owenia fusiformis]|uniref:Heparan-sulfate 6-O-sulfotransferase n=1 Tax=Owenia fusiformis TaxID=6347 RepID=A0A8J1V0Q0_OWEFU|nr:unnamed protein product [Owenia fusiformis]
MPHITRMFTHFFIVTLPVFFIILYYYPNEHRGQQPANIRHSESSSTKMEGIYKGRNGMISYKDVNYRKFNFDPNDDNIIILLRIQKTGGTWFESALARTLNITPRCLCTGIRSCQCLNNHGHAWLVSGYFTLGWPCGLHADWTELTECINEYFDKYEGVQRKRGYLYITQLREPIQRYVSEWKHVQRGATWKRRFKCNGQETANKLPTCFDMKWKNVALDEFINCPGNLAINRQTRMLANLSLVDCYNTSTIPKPERDRIMLESAKNNLKDMTYFGLAEYQKSNQCLFEYTFGVNFTKKFAQSKRKSYAEKSKHDISSPQLMKIKELNNLDIELYEYAKELYFQRLEKGNLLD